MVWRWILLFYMLVSVWACGGGEKGWSYIRPSRSARVAVSTCCEISSSKWDLLSAKHILYAWAASACGSSREGQTSSRLP
jgi:hypothetical protein